MGHTPGPWAVDKDSINDMWTNSISVADSDGSHVCHLTRGYESDDDGEGCPSFANARLIAAAKTMLEALVELLEWFDDESPAEAAVKARAAIALAKSPMEGE